MKNKFNTATLIIFCFIIGSGIVWTVNKIDDGLMKSTLEPNCYSSMQ